MNLIRMEWVLTVCLAWAAVARAEATRHRLSGGGLEVEIVVNADDLEAGQGPRFARTARVVSARAGGREFLTGPGLADEFSHDGVGAAGYAEAEGGGGFLKVGVGLLKRDAESARGYDAFWRYPVIEYAEARVTERGERVLALEARHAPAGGVAMTLGQRFEVSEGGVLRVEYALKNEGETAWRGRHYNHHFFAIGGRRPDDGHVLRPFGVPEVEPRAWRGWRRTEDGWRLTRWPTLARAAAAVFERAGEPGLGAEPGGFELANDAGGRVVARSSRAVVVFTAWADDRAVCPELFVEIEVAPGATAEWATEYRFE